MEEIICMTKEQWEEYHNRVWLSEARARQRRWDKRRAREAARRRLICKQKALGLFAIVSSIIGSIFVENMFCFLVLGTIGIGLLVTKKIVIYDCDFRDF